MVQKAENASSSPDYALWLVYLNVVLYATCFQIQRPLEPYLVDKLMHDNADSAQEYAKLQSFFSLIQTFGSLLSGRLLDMFGAKGGFIVNFLASALSYGLLSQATTLPILYASKIPTIFQAGFLCAQLAASQVTSDGPERVKALGRLTMSYTIGMVIGPSLGGFLGAQGDYYLGAKIAVAGSLLSFVLVLFLPNSLVQKPNTTEKDKAESSDVADVDSKDGKANESIPSYFAVISLVWLFLGTKFITSVANAMTGAAFPVIMKNEFKVNEQEMGLTMSISSVCNAVVNGLFLEPLTKSLGNDLCQVIGNCLWSMFLISVAQGAAALPVVANALPGQGLYQYVGIGLLFSIFQYVLSTTVTSESTSRVGPRAKGTLLGLEHALFAAARIVAPQMGITMLSSGGIPGVCFGAAGIFAAVAMLWNILSERGGTPITRVVGKAAERKEK